MGEVIQGLVVGVIEFERRDGNHAGVDGGVIAIGIDAVGDLLLVKPEIHAAARVGSFLQ